MIGYTKEKVNDWYIYTLCGFEFLDTLFHPPTPISLYTLIFIHYNAHVIGFPEEGGGGGEYLG